MTNVDALMQGAVDMHIHSGPGLIDRTLDHVEAAREAMEAGLRAIVIKDQHVPTAETARIIHKHIIKSEDFNIFGSVVLNNTAGGVNPRVVEAALGCGAKVIWMPTLAAKFHKEENAKLTGAAKAAMPKARFRLSSDPPISILDDGGKLIPEVREICKLIAEYDAVLGTGHLSWPETNALVDEAQAIGVQKIVLDHPEHLLKATSEQMRAFADRGVYIEHVLALVYSNKSSHERIYEMIKQHGAERAVIVSDLGQLGRPHPVEGMRNFITAMLELGMLEDDIRKVISKNPGDLLNIN